MSIVVYMKPLQAWRLLNQNADWPAATHVGVE